MFFRELKKNRIGFYLIKRILLLSVFITIILSLLICSYEYKKLISEIRDDLSDINSTYSEIVQRSIWVVDHDNLDLILKGIEKFESIEYAAVFENGNIIAEAGRKTRTGGPEFNFPVYREYKNQNLLIGNFYLKGSSSYVNRRIFNLLTSVIFTQGVTILIVVFFTLYFIYSSVGKRLLKVTKYARSISMDNLDIPFKEPVKQKYHDELDELVDAINRTREYLSRSFKKQKKTEKELEEHKKNLEKIVDERTIELKRINEKLKVEIDERIKIMEDLKKTLAEVRTLKGLLPICSGCKKIRDDNGYWNQIEFYISKYSEAEFSHGLCPECMKEIYGSEPWFKKKYLQNKNDKN